jgi:hypothetical protein
MASVRSGLSFCAMEMSAGSDSSDQDWRLQAELQIDDAHSTLHHLLGRLREPNVFKDVEAAVAHDVVITHDGSLLFAYAANEASIAAARRAIEEVLARDQVQAIVRVGHWDPERESWQQTDPPPSPEERRAEDAAERNGEEIETRTMVATSGKLLRAEFEQTMVAWADKLGLECTLIEHPHLLTTQIGFTVTGPKRKIDEFSRGLIAEGWTTVRTEQALSFGL